MTISFYKVRKTRTPTGQAHLQTLDWLQSSFTSGQQPHSHESKRDHLVLLLLSLPLVLAEGVYCVSTALHWADRGKDDQCYVAIMGGQHAGQRIQIRGH